MVWGSRFEDVEEDNYIGFDIEHRRIYIDYYDPKLINVIGIIEIEFHYYFEAGGEVFEGGITVPIQGNGGSTHWNNYKYPTGLVLDLQEHCCYNVTIDPLTTKSLRTYHSICSFFRIKFVHDPSFNDLFTICPDIDIEFYDDNDHMHSSTHLKGKYIYKYGSFNGPNVPTELSVIQTQDEYHEGGYIYIDGFELNSSTNNLYMDFHISLNT